MTPSSCAVSSLNSLITTETLINLSAFFSPRHERRGDFFFFFSLISACSFHFTEGKLPCRHVGHFSFPVFSTTRLEDGEVVHKLSPCLPRIWKRKIMQRSFLLYCQMLKNTFKSLSQPLVSCFLAVSVWRNAKKVDCTRNKTCFCHIN